MRVTLQSRLIAQMDELMEWKDTLKGFIDGC
jgi:hypothetical protein